MRWIYISPHLDDAVLSAGGLIYEQTRAGHEVEIWTFMCGFPSQRRDFSLCSVFAQPMGNLCRCRSGASPPPGGYQSGALVGAKGRPF